MGPQLRKELTKWTKEVSEKEVVTQEISSYLSGLWLKIYENREVLGIKDIVAKSLGTANPHNVIRACIKALKKQNSPKQISIIRNKKISEIIEKRG